jgi:hypothetical protein
MEVGNHVGVQIQEVVPPDILEGAYHTLDPQEDPPAFQRGDPAGGQVVVVVAVVVPLSFQIILRLICQLVLELKL